jgi:hypothetical protein
MSESASLPARPLRTLLGALVLAVAWGLLGALLSSPALGLLLLLWTLLVGPLLVPAFAWLSLRLRGRVKPLDYVVEAKLARAHFEALVRRPGPRPEIWVLGSHDRGLFWFESLFARKQVVIVTSGWLAGDEPRKRRDWDALWNLFSTTTRFRRLLRSFQMALWLGALAPLEFLFFCLRLLTDFLGFSDLPRAGFWFLGSCWRLREAWFGTSAPNPDVVRTQSWGVRSSPVFWDSLLWGVWFQMVPENVHPTLHLLTRSSSFLSSDPRLEIASRRR